MIHDTYFFSSPTTMKTQAIINHIKLLPELKKYIIIDHDDADSPGFIAINNELDSFVCFFDSKDAVWVTISTKKYNLNWCPIVTDKELTRLNAFIKPIRKLVNVSIDSDLVIVYDN